MAWTEDRVEVLKRLWSDGLSASQIARELGDVTRNAVIGKVHRLGLAGRASPTRPKSRLRHRDPTEYSSSYSSDPGSRIGDGIEPLVLPEPAVSENGDPINILTLNEKVCKWPIGEPGDKDFRFCGRKKSGGSSYCAEHTQLAYQPLDVRRKKRSRFTSKKRTLPKINDL
ncbi:MAG: GcrA cell cycle regulator [Rhodobiaceae bacterium]|jgi:GcrA cell cycle regulator|nr:GcrA cell cycle regulator [Rhodobiaceae bacterium]|tara:strand:+ start:1201 stop:1710 length:510 start_codon:yes stop_codon:yes gene_type:complete